MTAVATTARRIFSSLRVLNYRIYFAGQAVSLSGTWMQGVAQAWLVLDLTGSGTAIGLVLALQFLPILLLGPLGGVVADRADKRRLLVATQVAAALLATSLGLLVLFDVVRLWMVYALACGLGFVNLVDNPTRQAFVGEMVGPADLTNAVSLNSVLVNLARDAGFISLSNADLKLSDEDRQKKKSPSTWVVMARTQADLRGLSRDQRWHTLSVRPGDALWTDDFSDILSVFKWKSLNLSDWVNSITKSK